jgi:GntR family transcriptional regulator
MLLPRTPRILSLCAASAAGTFVIMAREEREAVPPWRQVADSLRGRIQAGEWLPGAALPTLDDLAAEYHVSRTTARKAISALTAEGLTESVRGWGTFVRR